MSKRSAAVETTRRRIVEATLELHGEQGILATSWEEIAERADVAPATVYRHFPSLDELVPACGALTMQRLELPTDSGIEEVLKGARSPRERIGRLVAETFAIYERGDPALNEIRRVRARLAPVQAAHEEIEARLDALTTAALELDERELAVVRALTDYEVWTALRERGIDGEDAVDTTAAVLEAWLRRRD